MSARPAPNTVLLGIPNAVVVFNEQTTASGEDASSITVNAIHIYVLGQGNPFNLPAGADVVIASAHSDVAGAGATGLTQDDETQGEGSTIIELPLASSSGETEAARIAPAARALPKSPPAPVPAPAPAPAPVVSEAVEPKSAPEPVTEQETSSSSGSSLSEAVGGLLTL